MKYLVAIVVVLVATVEAVNCSCATGWVPYEEHCYAAIDVGVEWQTARNICQEFDPSADLASINSIYEDAFLLSEFGEQHYWIGFNDISIDGTFVWANGDEVTYVNWESDQPNGGYREGCVYFLNYNSGGWADNFCTQKYPFICKMSMP